MNRIILDMIYAKKHQLVKQAVNELGVMGFKLTGTSMLPNFKARETIYVYSCHKLEIEEGHCVLYCSPHLDLVFHRIVKCIDRTCFLEKGDNSEGLSTISKSQIIGVYQENKRVGSPKDLELRSTLWDYEIIVSVRNSTLQSVKIGKITTLEQGIL